LRDQSGGPDDRAVVSAFLADDPAVKADLPARGDAAWRELQASAHALADAKRRLQMACVDCLRYREHQTREQGCARHQALLATW
jgi:anti-sigma factor RsiW